MKISEIIARYGNDYLILDFDHIFITDKIEDEIIMYFPKTHQEEALAEIEGLLLKVFAIHSYDRKKSLSKYSGGEKSILCFCLIITVIKTNCIKNLKIIFNNIIESLSENNRSIMKQQLILLKKEFNISVYQLKNGNVCDNEL